MAHRALSRKVGPVGAVPKTAYMDHIWLEEKRDGENLYKLTIQYGENYITSMEFKYKGRFNLPRDSIHCQSTQVPAPSFAMITLEKEEYITGLRGTYNSEHLTSLTFETNMRKYGPYGNASSRASSLLQHRERDKPFSFQFGPGNHFRGLHGVFRNNKLSAIGVYLKD